MKFNFRGKEIYLKPSPHGHLWAIGSGKLMIAKLIRIEIDTIFQLLDGNRKVIGYLSTSFGEIDIVGGVPMIGETA